jgi:hypothetical protein
MRQNFLPKTEPPPTATVALPYQLLLLLTTAAIRLAVTPSASAITFNSTDTTASSVAIA